MRVLQLAAATHTNFRKHFISREKFLFRNSLLFWGSYELSSAAAVYIHRMAIALA